MTIHRLHWGALAALCVANGAYAHPEDTVRPWLEYNVTHDSNYFRVANDAQALAQLGSTNTAVTTYRSGVGVDADLRMGRQLVALRGALSKVKYDHQMLKPTSEWRASADWIWVLGNRLTGSLNYRIQESLQSQADASSTEQSKQEQTNIGFRASYQVHPSFYLDYGVNEATFVYSPATRKGSDRSERSQNVGWRMPTRAGNHLGMQYTKTDGEYPNQSPVQRYEQTEYNLNGSWAPTGISRLSWAVGQTRRIDGPTTLNQPTWSLSAGWTPTGKTSFNASLGRSVGSSETATVSNTTITDTATLGVTWSATAKITMSANLRGQNLEYTPVGRTDQVRSGGLSLGYQMWRSGQATMSYDTERRNSTVQSAEYRNEKWSVGLRAAF